jgi:integrase
VTLTQSPSTIEAWVAGLPLAPSTARKVFERLNAILSAAVRDGRIGANPCQGARLPRVTSRKVVPWTAPQIIAVRGALPDRLAAFVDAGVNLGMRQSELFGLAVEDVEFLTGVVHVRHQVKLIGNRPRFAPPKSKSERDVPLSTRAREALAAHLAKYPAPRVTLPWHEPKTRRHGKPVTLSLVFPNAAGRALSRPNFNSLQWRPALRSAGLEDCPANGCHMMRHVFASTLIAAGVDVRTVAEYLGHSDGGGLVLRTYSHLMPNAGDKTRRALDEALTLDTPDDDGLASCATNV